MRRPHAFCLHDGTPLISTSAEALRNHRRRDVKPVQLLLVDEPLRPAGFQDKFLDFARARLQQNAGIAGF